jgi:hypothetical protein
MALSLVAGGDFCGCNGSFDCCACLRAIFPARTSQQARGFRTNAVGITLGKFAQAIDAHLLEARNYSGAYAFDSKKDSTLIFGKRH